MKKKKMLKLLFSISTSNAFKFLLSLGAILAFVFVVSKITGSNSIDWRQMIELKTALTITVTGLIAYVVLKLNKFLEKKLEESFKIIDDYHEIIKKYPLLIDSPCNNECQLMSIKNINIIKLKRNADKIYHKTDVAMYNSKKSPSLLIPYLSIFENKEKNASLTIVDNPHKNYTAPIFIQAHFDSILLAHRDSFMKNEKKVRLDSVSINGNQLDIHTSRTDFFNSMVTNRAMDYVVAKNVCVRNLYEYDITLSDLDKSMLSNHLGINVLLTSNDKYAILFKRDEKRSVSKGKIGPTFDSSLNYNDAVRFFDNTLDYRDAVNRFHNELFTVEGIERAIRKGIQHKTGLTNIEYLLSTNFLGLARDLTEGGKPNLFFHIMVDIPIKDIKQTVETHTKFKKPKFWSFFKRDNFYDEPLYIPIDSIKPNFYYEFEYNGRKYELSHPVLTILSYLNK